MLGETSNRSTASKPDEKWEEFLAICMPTEAIAHPLSPQALLSRMTSPLMIASADRDQRCSAGACLGCRTLMWKVMIYCCRAPLG